MTVRIHNEVVVKAEHKRLTLDELRKFVNLLNIIEADGAVEIGASITWGGKVKSLSASVIKEREE